MQIKLLNKKIIEFFNLASIIILYAWISFFPQPVQERFDFAINIFLIAVQISQS